MDRELCVCQLGNGVDSALKKELKGAVTRGSRTHRERLPARSSRDAPGAEDCISGEAQDVTVVAHNHLDERREVLVDMSLETVDSELGGEVREARDVNEE